MSGRYGVKGASLPTGEWTHVAVVAVGLDESAGRPEEERRCTLFVNGKEVGGGAVGRVGKKWPESASLVVGNAAPGGQAPFRRGRIDELAVWQRALSAAEIASLYQQNKAGKSLRQILAAGRPTVAVHVEKEEAKVADGSPATIVFKRSSKQGSFNLRISGSGWADSGLDYKPFPDLLPFPAGTDEARLAVVPLADKSPKGRWSLDVTLEESASFMTSTRAPGSAKAWIVGADWGKPLRLPKKIYGHYMGCFVPGRGAMRCHRTSGLATMDAPPGAPTRFRR